ncbi:hypothetical protein TNCV_3273831 [Trichonephila clavipes]|nr:hypothetical protein TNCV_3273831 [Trichonephila clavipes]
MGSNLYTGGTKFSKNGGASPPRTAFVHVPNFDQNRNFFNPGLYTGGVFMLSSNLYTVSLHRVFQKDSSNQRLSLNGLGEASSSEQRLDVGGRLRISPLRSPRQLMSAVRTVQRALQWPHVGHHCKQKGILSTQDKLESGFKHLTDEQIAARTSGMVLEKNVDEDKP